VGFSKFAAFELGCRDGSRCHFFASAYLAVFEGEAGSSEGEPCERSSVTNIPFFAVAGTTVFGCWRSLWRVASRRARRVQTGWKEPCLGGFRKPLGDGFIFLAAKNQAQRVVLMGKSPVLPDIVAVAIHSSGIGVAEPNGRTKGGRPPRQMRDASSAADRAWRLRTANTLLIHDWPMPQKPGIVFRRIG
jgi:hypothetical protein